ncbi:MAG: DUF2779 domain-containing protein [Elusimicrobiota bacterium]|jgi:hypothetical protein|nr:DUF2779 domain-containing protein [Elusimicrobiota bacterium]
MLHKKSEELFPEAINVKKEDQRLSLQYSLELIKNPDNKTLISTYFTDGIFIARTDIIKRDQNNPKTLDLIKVNAGKDEKAKYINDLAFVSMVILRSGTNINSASTMLISNNYRLGMDTSKMFVCIDSTQKVENKTLEYLILSDKAAVDLEYENMPKPVFKKCCNKCPFFYECIGKDIKNSIFDLPKLSALKAEELIEKNIRSIEEIPEDFELTQQQKIVKDCIENNSIYISPSLKTEIDSFNPPYYYLDFESINTILPIYPDIAPHSQIITQFSVHKCLIIDEISQHFEYIADEKKDDQYNIAKNLINCLGDKGDIFTYASFEKIAIQRFAALFEDLSLQLLNIASRIVDFEKIIRENYYDIRFHGRSSIKIILPILTKDTNYDNLEISKGGDAAAAFAFMAMGLYDEEKCKETKKYLLQYCAQDTMAMVKIHKFLFEAVKNLK